ncbi:MAG: hydantoinase/oxoprolinase family protein [Alphaproteobacteria bacterium]|nr:hydantoinase/oxoprolinase family protein [Alphaproteobacteria bacterium]
MTWRIGVDIGGTFIDFCALHSTTHQLETIKVLTTPEAPGQELLQGLDLLRERHGILPEEVVSFVHGTTVGINTVIQRKGSRMGLLTTAGFEDVIELARLRMPDMYSLFCARPDQLVPRDLVFGVRERVLADGQVQIGLDREAVIAAVEGLRRKGAEGVIVSFLHAYRNPAHEKEARQLIETLAPEMFVFCASEVWPVIREYERTTTALLNGYVHRRVAGYLESLASALRERRVPALPMLTKSNGGLMTAETGKRSCVNMLLSGTAAGVMGASFIGRQAGIPHLLTLDIGGTSADLAVVIDGEAQYGTGEQVGEFPLYLPSVSVTSIGAGGGSIAWMDGFGVLKVGPESAGSSPGPACYGKGGVRPTVTDAMAVCGYLGLAPMAYGQIGIQLDKAETAVGGLAEKLGIAARSTAAAIIDIAVSEMLIEVNKLVARYGIDLHEFTLLPFGGAGPMLGCFLAREVGIPRVLVPNRPGVVSALGGLIADIRGDFIQTVYAPSTPQSVPMLRDMLVQLKTEGQRWIRHDQNYDGAVAEIVSAEMRYHGQSFEIEVSLEQQWILDGDVDAINAAFHRRHREIYDFNDESGSIQIINLRLVTVGATPKPDNGSLLSAPAKEAVPARHVDVWLDGREQRIGLHHRRDLVPGHCFAGPAIVVQDDTTICIPGGFRADVDEHRNLILLLES